MNDRDWLWVGLSVGWSLGALVMWYHFWANGLIRSRKEWYAHRRSQGRDVPHDWDREG